jgi:hypothetical protein
VCESGPARTLKMRLSGSKEICIDLVPAIEFKANTPQPPPFRKLPYTFVSDSFSKILDIYKKSVFGSTSKSFSYLR